MLSLAETSTETYWAYRLEGLGLDSLARRQWRRGELAEGEVRVRVAAAAINYRDLVLARGEYLPEMARPFVPLSEGAGIVIEVGAGVTDLATGEAVLGHYTSDWIAGDFRPTYHHSKIGGPLDGWLAEEVVMPRQALLRAPAGWSLEESASLAISGVTAWRALGEPQALKGRHVLIEGTGNVSLLALEIAAKAGAFPVVLTSRPRHREALMAMGASAVIGPGTLEERRQGILEATGGQGLSLAIEVLGGTTLTSLVLPLMRVAGRVAIVGFLDSPEVHGDLIGPMLRGLLRLEGISVGSRADFEALLAFMQCHDLRPRIAARFAPEEIREALVHRAEGLGKTVIIVDPDLTG